MEAIFNFLQALQKHNNREWFQAHKVEFMQAQELFTELIEGLLAKVAAFDPQLKNLTAKDCIFRIYKDVRFSKDKHPYKTHFGASLSPGGKKTAVAGYYLHLDPGNSFFGGGLYQPDKDTLHRLRLAIQQSPGELLHILQDRHFKQYFGDLDQTEMLKTAPRGFDKNDPHIDLLRHKHFIATAPLLSEAVLSDEKTLSNYVVNGYKAMYPLVHYLR